MDTDLRTFLRERRRRIDPGAVGLPRRRGRRTPGLAREDMAELLDVTPLWYALFESGTSQRRFSLAFLERVSAVLHLDPHEHETLFCLVIGNGNAAPDVELAWSRRCWSSLASAAADVAKRIEEGDDAERTLEDARRSLRAVISIGESWRWQQSR